MVQPQLELSAGGPGTLGPLQIKMRLGQGAVALALGFEPSSNPIATGVAGRRLGKNGMFRNYWVVEVRAAIRTDASLAAVRWCQAGR
jgi:hypothetical protein